MANANAETEAEEMTRSETGLLAKLTLAGMGLNKPVLQKLVKDNPKKTLEIATIMILASGATAKPSRFDTSKNDFRFSGTVEGQNMLTGEIFKSGALYLPKMAEEWLKGELEAAIMQAKVEGKEQVRIPAIAFRVTVVEDLGTADRESAVGYKFGVKSLMAVTKADPFADIRKRLPAPKKAGK